MCFKCNAKAPPKVIADAKKAQELFDARTEPTSPAEPRKPKGRWAKGPPPKDGGVAAKVARLEAQIAKFQCAEAAEPAEVVETSEQPEDLDAFVAQCAKYLGQDHPTTALARSKADECKPDVPDKPVPVGTAASKLGKARKAKLVQDKRVVDKQATIDALLVELEADKAKAAECDAKYLEAEKLHAEALHRTLEAKQEFDHIAFEVAELEKKLGQNELLLQFKLALPLFQQ